MTRRVVDRAGVGLERLHEHAARRIAAAAAGELRDQLERPLLGAEVGHREAGVGVDHRGQLDTREVMALGDHLRAEQHGAIGRGEALQRGVEKLRRLCRVGVKAGSARVGGTHARARAQPLRAGTEARKVYRQARGTCLRHRFGVAAVVTAQRVVAVQHERNVAVRTANRLAAGATVKRGRNTAAVEQQNRLAAALLDRSQLGEERRRQRIAGLAAQVDDLHARQVAGEPSTQFEPFEARPALRPRRRRAVDRDRAFERSALRSDGARVVRGVGVLLVGGVVLFVDDDQPEATHRSKDRGARADDDSRLATCDPLALVAALGIGQPRMENCDAVAEA